MLKIQLNNFEENNTKTFKIVSESRINAIYKGKNDEIIKVQSDKEVPEIINHIVEAVWISLQNDIQDKIEIKKVQNHQLGSQKFFNKAEFEELLKKEFSIKKLKMNLIQRTTQKALEKIKNRSTNI